MSDQTLTISLGDVSVSIAVSGGSLKIGTTPIADSQGEDRILVSRDGKLEESPVKANADGWVVAKGITLESANGIAYGMDGNLGFWNAYIDGGTAWQTTGVDAPEFQSYVAADYLAVRPVNVADLPGYNNGVWKRFGRVVDALDPVFGEPVAGGGDKEVPVYQDRDNVWRVG